MCIRDREDHVAFGVDVGSRRDTAGGMGERHVEDRRHLPLILAVADQRRVAAGAEGQRGGVEEDGLAGAGFARQHGQTLGEGQIEPETHRAVIDAYGGLGSEVEAVRATWKGWREARKAVEEAQARLAKARADGDFLRHAVDELTSLRPEAGEETDLAGRRQAMMASEKIASDLADAMDVLAGPGSAVPSLAAAWRRLERRAAQAPALVEPIVKAFGEALDRIEDARAAVEAAQRASEFDPRELERIEERLFALRAASRKYAVPVEGLADLAARYLADVSALDAGEDRLVALQAAATAAEAAYGKAAATLSAKRKAAAKRLDTAVNAELGPLKLDSARFMTELAADGSGAEGIDRAEFWVQTNPGTRPGPMMKVASGGELSRFMLALKVVLADQGSAPTLVFDEIDTGVGGAVADAIGQRLARLGAKVQVLSVTHAPQVAAKATRHYLIAKETTGKSAATRVKPLGFDLRREELARMLAGETITDEARAAAEKLLTVG